MTKGPSAKKSLLVLLGSDDASISLVKVISGPVEILENASENSLTYFFFLTWQSNKNCQKYARNKCEEDKQEASLIESVKSHR